MVTTRSQSRRMNEQQQQAFNALQATVQQLQNQLTAATTDATQQRTLLQAAQNQIATLQNPVQAQGNVTFATSPALTNNTVINLESKIGYKLYETAIAPVHSTKFDGTKTEVQVFRDHVQVKASEQGWNTGTGNIFQIPDTSVTPQVSRDIIYRTQEVSTEQIKTFAATIINSNDRATQNNVWDCKSLFASITDKCRRCPDMDIHNELNDLIVPRSHLNL